MLATGSFLVKPAEIEYVLGKCSFAYPLRFEADQYRGWSRYAVIPGLFGLMVELGHFPSADEATRLLYENCERVCRDDPKVKRRGEKLYLDFARDMHSLGLLQVCDFFGVVSYQKVEDMRYNVDFIARLLSELEEWINPKVNRVGIQAAMRRVWGPTDSYDAVKAQRRASRGDYTWAGPIYWLTNKTRPPAKKVAGCWLFGPKHVEDLADEIAGDFGIPRQGGGSAPAEVAIDQVEQLEMF